MASSRHVPLLRKAAKCRCGCPRETVQAYVQSSFAFLKALCNVQVMLAVLLRHWTCLFADKLQRVSRNAIRVRFSSAGAMQNSVHTVEKVLFAASIAPGFAAGGMINMKKSDNWLLAWFNVAWHLTI